MFSTKPQEGRVGAYFDNKLGDFTSSRSAVSRDFIPSELREALQKSNIFTAQDLYNNREAAKGIFGNKYSGILNEFVSSYEPAKDKVNYALGYLPQTETQPLETPGIVAPAAPSKPTAISPEVREFAERKAAE
jgi:hypothetical protein